MGGYPDIDELCAQQASEHGKREALLYKIQQLSIDRVICTRRSWTCAP